MKLIACIAKNGIIGHNNTLPRGRIQEDMQRFYEKTQDSIVIMGRKTYVSLGKALPNRQIIVLSTTQKYPLYEDYSTIFINDIEKIKDIVKEDIEYMGEGYKKNRDIYCIGGYTIYKYCLDEGLIDTVRLTLLKHDYIGDTYFPYNSFYQSQKQYKLFFEKRGQSSKIDRFIGLSVQG